MNGARVALAQVPHADYPSAAPFHPSERYPEYAFGELASTPNHAYAAVREALASLGLDRTRFGTSAWNPLADIISPGDRVVIKPNWVHHELRGEPRPEEILITHPSVLRAVLDYVVKACGPTGHVTIGDAPIQSADFDQILAISQMAGLLEWTKRVTATPVVVADFRSTRARVSASGRVIQEPSSCPDPAGYHEVDLGADSMLEEVSDRSRRFRIFDYDPKLLRANHGAGMHKYLIAGSVLDADVVVNVPKLKAHGKCGITCSLKNLVGINGDKAYLPHFRTGSPSSGGDDYPFRSPVKWARTHVRELLARSGSEFAWRWTRSVGRSLLGVGKRLRSDTVGGVNPYDISSGHWYGNDTAWRMVLDLNLLLLRPTTAGRTRRYLSIVDGIHAGEGNGPLYPRRRRPGAILAGASPVAVDVAAAWMMGFDPERIPLLREAAKRLGVSFPLRGDASEVSVVTRDSELPLHAIDIHWGFCAPDGWRGSIERAEIAARVGA